MCLNTSDITLFQINSSNIIQFERKFVTVEKNNSNIILEIIIRGNERNR